MASDRNVRQRLRATVLEANTPAGKIYNLVIFGAILLSVVVLLLEPNPLGNSALQQTEVLWIDLVQTVVYRSLLPILSCIWRWCAFPASTCSALPA